jgi:clusterin-associated protein 1
LNSNKDHMSFRELRDFTETLRLLRYPRQVSIESFRNPNFELVADILHWLTMRLDPTANVVHAIETERERISFLRQCSDTIGNKGRLRLNMRRVYQADGYAVRELTRVANILRDAMNSIDLTNIGESNVDDIAVTQLVSQVQSTSGENRVQEVKALRQLTSEITQQASALYMLYGAENTMRSRRNKVVNKHSDMGEVERRLRELVTNITTHTESLSETLTNLQADEKNLEQKMDTKRAQLERQQKRLKALQAVRPAFMEEYEKQEMELQRQYAVYLEQYRNLEYLENELAKCTKLEDSLLTEQEVKLRLLREKLRKEELKVLRGEAVEGDGNDIGALDSMEGAMSDAALDMARQAAAAGGFNASEGLSRPRAASGRQRPSTKDGVSGGGQQSGRVDQQQYAGRNDDRGATKQQASAKGNVYGGGEDETDSDLDDLDEDDDDDDGNISGDDDGDDDDVSAGSDDDGGGDDDDDVDSNDS